MDGVIDARPPAGSLLEQARDAWCRGDFETAEAVFGEAAAVLRGQGEPMLPMLAAALTDQGDCAARRGRHAAAQAAFGEALAIQRRVLEVTDPALVRTLYGLGWARRGLGELDEAVRCFSAAIQVQDAGADPTHRVRAMLHTARGSAWMARGDCALAEADFLAAAKLQRLHGCATEQAATLNMAGEAAFQTERFKAARLHQEAALALLRAAPSVLPRVVAETMSNLGMTLHMLRDEDASAEMLRQALALAPDLHLAARGLASVLLAQGHAQEAAELARQTFSRQSIIEEPAAGATATMLLLVGLNGGIPYRHLLARRPMNRARWSIEYAADAHEQALPRYDMVFNAVGDADRGEAALRRAQSFRQRCQAPFLNEPAQVLRTQRDRIPDLLAGIEDVVMPRVARVGRDELMRQRLENQGWRFPLLLREAGRHGGEGVLKLADPAAVQAAARQAAGGDFYLSEFHDYSLPDGFFRKYRVIFVDRVAYPYHLAISPRWLVHYFSAEMPAHAWKLAEEMRFLQDPRAALGERAWRAVEAIGRRMDLDYCGADLSLLPDGRVLLFEANATMLVHPEESEKLLLPKNPYVERILRAFDAMLDRSVGGG